MASEKKWRAVARKNSWQVQTVQPTPQHICTIDTGLIEQEKIAHQIAATGDLLEAAQLCQKVLALLTEAKHTATNDPAVSVVNAWAQCVEAEAKARAAITKATSS